MLPWYPSHLDKHLFRTPAPWLVSHLYCTVTCHLYLYTSHKVWKGLIFLVKTIWFDWYTWSNVLRFRGTITFFFDICAKIVPSSLCAPILWSPTPWLRAFPRLALSVTVASWWVTLISKCVFYTRFAVANCFVCSTVRFFTDYFAWGRAFIAMIILVRKSFSLRKEKWIFFLLFVFYCLLAKTTAGNVSGAKLLQHMRHCACSHKHTYVQKCRR